VVAEEHVSVTEEHISVGSSAIADDHLPSSAVAAEHLPSGPVAANEHLSLGPAAADDQKSLVPEGLTVENMSVQPPALKVEEGAENKEEKHKKKKKKVPTYLSYWITFHIDDAMTYVVIADSITITCCHS
jgi:hypothetical protein